MQYSGLVKISEKCSIFWRSKWDVSVSMRLSIDYDGIIAETKEEAIEIAKSKALEDIDYNNCDCDTSNPIVYCCLEEES